MVAPPPYDGRGHDYGRGSLRFSAGRESAEEMVCAHMPLTLILTGPHQQLLGSRRAAQRLVPLCLQLRQRIRTA